MTDRQSTIDFPDPAARRTDPETSHMAADDAKLTASRGRKLALCALLRFGPMTDFELADRTGLQQNSIGKRRLDCQRVGLVRKCLGMNDEPIRRATPTGSSAQVWELTPAGVDKAIEWLKIL